MCSHTFVRYVLVKKSVQENKEDRANKQAPYNPQAPLPSAFLVPRMLLKRASLSSVSQPLSHPPPSLFGATFYNCRPLCSVHPYRPSLSLSPSQPLSNTTPLHTWCIRCFRSFSRRILTIFLILPFGTEYDRNRWPRSSAPGASASSTQPVQVALTSNALATLGVLRATAASASPQEGRPTTTSETLARP